MRHVDKKLFRREKSQTTVEKVIDQIHNLLINKEIIPGDKLPSELEISENLNVSRGSVREAMKILSAFGIITIQPGNGTYVSKEMGKGLFDYLLFQLILSDYNKEKLFELRYLLEVGMIQMVIENATKVDIDKMWEVHYKMAKEVESEFCDNLELTNLDLIFHKTIASATKNILIEKIYSFTMDLYVPLIKESIYKGNQGKVSLKIHKDIILGFENKSYDRVFKAQKKSLDVWFNLISTASSVK